MTTMVADFSIKKIYFELTTKLFLRTVSKDTSIGALRGSAASSASIPNSHCLVVANLREPFPECILAETER